MTNKSPAEIRITKLAQARQEHGDTMKDLEDRFKYSDRYLYEVIRYRDKNPSLYDHLANYCKEAGFEFPSDNLANSHK